MISFLISRVVLRALVGLEYDTSSLRWAWQLLDPTWLKAEPLFHVWHMHMQPPLFNLLTAAVLRIPFPPEYVLDPLYLTLGALTTVVLYSIARRLGLSEMTSSLAVTIIFVLNPASVIYETWYFYTYPSLFLTALATLSMMEFARTRKMLPLIGTFTSLSLLILLRSTYSLLLIPIVGMTLIRYAREMAREIILTATLTGSLPGLWYVKNTVKFGLPSSSSWFPMNLLRLIVGEHPLLTGNRMRILELYRQGKVSAAAILPPFSPPELYEDVLGPSEPTGVEVLDAHRKPSTGRINYNHRIYLQVFHTLTRDHMSILRSMPYAYAVGMVAGAVYFTLPPYAHIVFSRRLFTARNRERIRKIRAWLRTYDVLYGWPGGRFPGLTVVLLLVVFLWKLPNAIRDPMRAAPSALLLYLVMVHAPFERGENMRFRFQFESVLMLFVLRDIRDTFRSQIRDLGKSSI